ncbi:YtcA family lipoprotein [Shigella sonnei]
MVSGCSLSPAIPVIGAYYPGWFFCAIASLILTLITRRIIQRTEYQSGICRNYLYRPFCSLRHAVLAGIFLIYLRRAHGKVRRKKLLAVNSLLC